MEDVSRGGDALPPLRFIGWRRRAPVADAPPVPKGWARVLDRLGIPRHDADHVAARARRNGTGLHAELVAGELASEEAVIRALAHELDLDFVADTPPANLVIREDDVLASLRLASKQNRAFCEDEDGRLMLHSAPVDLDLAGMARFIERYPGIAQRLRLTTPSALRRSLMARASGALLRNAMTGLEALSPSMSAREVANSWQGFVVGIFVVALPAGLLLAPFATWTALHLFFSVFFLACVMLRLVAAGSAQSPAVEEAALPDAARLPVYSVLVALRDEAHMVPDLLLSLARLEWPRSKLEIKLVCEADDHATLAALRGRRLRPWVEVVVVPPAEPRTKPKALNFALPLCTGELVVLYDAEDRPHPRQLVEAWSSFERAGPDLVCVQAPLLIANGGSGWISHMFAFEYAALFRGILPWLSRRRLMFPLGGTSNHFRRAALVEMGGWDPYNVTEDADLGIRLARRGV